MYMIIGEYMAIFTIDTYAVIPGLHEISICLATQGHVCVPYIILYPAGKKLERMLLPCLYNIIT